MASQRSEFDFNHWLYRFLALVIDSIIIGIPAYIIYAFAIEPLLWTPVSIGFGMTINTAPWWSSLLLPFILGIIELFYFAVLDMSWGATVGKRLLGLQVQMVNGSKIDFGKAFIRNISKIYGLFLFLDWIIGIVTPGADRRQKYTDRIAGTTVVSIKQAFPAGMPPPPPPPPT
jgi:uncharacterized RDD family membrane protein YckC